MKILSLRYKIIALTCLFISFNSFAYDVYCSYRQEGRLCNYRGYPGGKCTLLDNNRNSSYCGDNGERCYCSKPDYVHG
ncbi:MAG: hypothetical protein P4L22_00420 [Candidatus Babeliales bacterium]|nr:hypothetical protein [Candidatus Babeliales bacterium]